MTLENVLTLVQIFATLALVPAAKSLWDINQRVSRIEGYLALHKEKL